MEFIDIINLGNGKYIKRYWKEASGKKEMVELECSMSAYSDYLEKKGIRITKGDGDRPYSYDVIQDHQKDIDTFNFNQQSNFLYHFVNKFTDTEVPIEAIREELKNML